MSTFVAGHLPEFFPNPEAFQPERWNRENVELPSAFSSLPFGFGRRSCVGKFHPQPSSYIVSVAIIIDFLFPPGRRVAELEMHILLAQMMRNFRIEYRKKEPMEFENQLVFRPARKMNLALVDL